MTISHCGHLTISHCGHLQTECGAIMMYLAEKYGGVDTLEERAVQAKWIFFAYSEMVAWTAKESRAWSRMPDVSAQVIALRMSVHKRLG
jgi:glutathione S-transferase